MVVIGILNSKGGVGKSILTAALAVRASRDGLVCVVDLDSQGSYWDWYSRRGSPDNPALLFLLAHQPQGLVGVGG